MARSISMAWASSPTSPTWPKDATAFERTHVSSPQSRTHAPQVLGDPRLRLAYPGQLDHCHTAHKPKVAAAPAPWPPYGSWGASGGGSTSKALRAHASIP